MMVENARGGKSNAKYQKANHSTGSGQESKVTNQYLKFSRNGCLESDEINEIATS